MGQNISVIDSLKNTLKDAGNSQQIEIYNQLAWEYRKSFPDSTVFFSQKAIDIASKSAELNEKVVKALNFKGVGHFYEGENIKAFELYQQAKDSSLIYGDSLQYGYSLNNIGRLYFNQGNYVAAYDNFFMALEIFKNLDDAVSMSYVYKSLSELYQSQNDLEKALEMSLKTAELRQTFDDPSGVISIYLEIAGIYGQMENYNNSLKYFTVAYEVASKINDEANLAIIKLSIARMNTKRGQLAIALTNANEALDFASKAKNINLIIQVYSLLGEIHFYRNEYDLSKDYFLKVTDLSTINDITFEQKAYFYLSTIYEKNGDINQALKYFKKYADLKEKTENVNTAREIERLEGRLALEAKENENKLLKQNEDAYKQVIQKQKALNIALVAVIVLTITLLIIIWVTANRRRKHNTILQLKNHKIEEQQKKISLQNKEIKSQNGELIVRNKELDDLNNEKDSLLNLVAHDMKAPFHRIKGLTELLRLSGLNEEQSQYVTMIRNNAKHGAYLINDLLDVNSMSVDKEELATDNIDLKKLLDDSASNFIIELTNKEIDCKIECEPGIIVRTDKTHINRILENLISNAVKFSKLGSDIILRAGVTKTNYWISVKDFGPGFTDDDKSYLFKKFKKLTAKPTGGESSNGLGLAIVKTLVDRLDGRINLETEIGKYSEFTIYFPRVDE
ncbi:tetratricopeptide repeat-containing sensor histidine kinase [Marivirga sp.]|uniref:tetratricopeptide repeat-containing sensor histidine kinase n=1 Tax=Marivirga sp. TaxID=2018662 RepID=UPI002D7FB784|nr:tetratricopeptide repeat-containing sensor histidine kinase [Marivirga sp.]HET8859782.1 tetratricopeptide repeat-containing sensor histidine kinase [Marivirga sp.]